MEMKLFDSELKVMGVLWSEGDCPARHIAEVLTGEYGWNVNTTYTLIKRCMKREPFSARNPTLCAMPSYRRRRCRKRKPTN